MDREQKIKIISEAAAAAEGPARLACAKAFDIKREYGIPLQEIGEICNEQKIKVAHCQLGCFS